MTSYQETDTAAVDGAKQMCSPTGTGTGPQAFQGSQGGSAGSAAHTATLNGAISASEIMWESPSGDPNNTSWPAGNWVVRLNVTSANANLQWDACYICRCNSSGVSQGTVGSLTGQGISLGTTGVKSMTVSGSAQSAAATDRWYIVLVLKSTSAGIQSCAFHSDQLIDTPFGVVAFDADLFTPRRRRPAPRRRRRKRPVDLPAGHLIRFPPVPPPLLEKKQRPRRRGKKVRNPTPLLRKTPQLAGPPPFAGPLHTKPRRKRRGKRPRNAAALLRQSAGPVKSLTPALCAQATVLEAIGGPLLVLEALAASGLVLEKLSAAGLVTEKLAATAAVVEKLTATATTLCS